MLLTEDKDFGQLVYAGSRRWSGVILIRFPAQARKDLPAAVILAIQKLGDRLKGAFVVLEPNRIRIGRNPE